MTRSIVYFLELDQESIFRRTVNRTILGLHCLSVEKACRKGAFPTTQGCLFDATQTDPWEFVFTSQLFTAGLLAHLPCSSVSTGWRICGKASEKPLLWLNEGIFGSWSQVSRPFPRRLEIVVFRLQCRTVFIFLGLCLNNGIWLNLDIFVWTQCAELTNHVRITRKQDDGTMTFRAMCNVSGLVSGNGLGSVSKIWIFNVDISCVIRRKCLVCTLFKRSDIVFSSSSFLNASQCNYSTTRADSIDERISIIFASAISWKSSSQFWR